MNDQDNSVSSEPKHSDQWRKLAFESYCYSALCSPEPPSVRDAMEIYTKEWGDALCYMLVPVDKLEQIREEAERLGYLEEGYGVNDVFIQTTQTLRCDDAWRDQVSEGIADCMFYLKGEGFVHGVHRLWLDDMSHAAEVEKYASEEVSRQTVGSSDPFVQPCIGFLPSASAAETLASLSESQCALKLDPLTGLEAEWISDFLRTAKSLRKDVHFANGERPTLTRRVESGRYELGWLNLRLAQAMTSGNEHDLLLETRSDAIRLEANRVVWKDQGLSVGYSQGLYDSDCVRNVDSELAAFAFSQS